MLVKIKKIKCDFGNEYISYYFEDKNGDTYYWRTNSEKAYTVLPEADFENKNINIKSYTKSNNTFKDETGNIVTVIKNVRFEVMK